MIVNVAGRAVEVSFSRQGTTPERRRFVRTADGHLRRWDLALLLTPRLQDHRPRARS